MAFEFKTVSKPVIKRTTNPFIEVVAELTPGKEEAKAFSMPNRSKDDEKAIRVALRQLTEAGAENNVTVRRNVIERQHETEITFWTVPKIVHGEKSADMAELEKEIRAEVEKTVTTQIQKVAAKKG